MWHQYHHFQHHAGNFLCFDTSTWTAIFTGLATCIIAIYAIRQYRQSRISGEKQLRAYVYVEPRPMGPSHTFGGVVIKNGGQTPAYEVSAWIKVGRCPRNKMCSETLDWNGAFIPQPSIHMSRDEAFFLEPKETPINLAGSKPEDNNPMIYWGIVKYIDTFGKSHSTEFRFGVDWLRYDPFEKNVWVVTTVCPGTKAT